MIIITFLFLNKAVWNHCKQSITTAWDFRLNLVAMLFKIQLIHRRRKEHCHILVTVNIFVSNIFFIPKETGKIICSLTFFHY